MILTAHQPQYLPGLRLFAKIASADLFVIFDISQFESKSFENRNFIKTQAGPLLLTAPVAMKDHFSNTGATIELAPGPWQRKHIKSISLAYGKAPYFRDYAEDLFEILGRPYRLLAEINAALLAYFLAALRITTPVVKASDYSFDGEKSGLVLDMCRKLGATTYIFGAQGVNYADVDAFRAAGVEPKFQQFTPLEYPQLHGAFAANMSAIDLLLNAGPGSLDVINRCHGYGVQKGY